MKQNKNNTNVNPIPRLALREFEEIVEALGLEEEMKDEGACDHLWDHLPPPTRIGGEDVWPVVVLDEWLRKEAKTQWDDMTPEEREMWMRNRDSARYRGLPGQ